MSNYRKQPIPPRLREKVFARDKHTCRYCGDKNGPFQADHVYPESKGGETTLNNLVTACEKCNNKKRAKIGVWPKQVDYFDTKKRIDKQFPFAVEFIGGIGLAVFSISFIYPQYFNGYIVALSLIVLLVSLVAEVVWRMR